MKPFTVTVPRRYRERDEQCEIKDLETFDSDKLPDCTYYQNINYPDLFHATPTLPYLSSDGTTMVGTGDSYTRRELLVMHGATEILELLDRIDGLKSTPQSFDFSKDRIRYQNGEITIDGGKYEVLYEWEPTQAYPFDFETSSSPNKRTGV